MPRMTDKILEIDVVIPTYNRAELISRSVNSVLNQSYPIRKVFVVDDASDDNTEDELKKICDERVFYLKNDKRRGANFSRNIGIMASNAQYIAFHDSDDVWHQDKIEKQVRALQSDENVRGVFSPYWLMQGTNKTLIGDCKEDDIDNIHSKLLCGNVIGTPTLLIGRDVITDVGLFDEKLPKYQDWDLALRITEKYQLAYVYEPLVTAYRLSESITTNEKHAAEALKRIAKRNLNDIKSEGLLNRWVELFLTNCSLDSNELKSFCKTLEIDLGLENQILSSLLLSTQSKLKRADKYLDMACDILEMETVTSYLKRIGISRVFVYGNSRFGKALCKRMEREGISVPAFIDRDVNKFCDKPIYTIEQFLEFFDKESTVVINTVPILNDKMKNLQASVKVYNITELIRI